MGQSGVHVRSSWSPGSGLCPARPPDHGAHLGGQSGTFCAQVPGSLAEETGRMGKCPQICFMLIKTD